MSKGKLKNRGKSLSLLWVIFYQNRRGRTKMHDGKYFPPLASNLFIFFFYIYIQMSNEIISPKYHNFCPDMEVLLKPSPNQMALHLSESWFVSKKATKVRSGTVSLVCLKQHNILHCSPWMTLLWPHFCQARPTFIVIMGQWQAQVKLLLFYIRISK